MMLSAAAANPGASRPKFMLPSDSDYHSTAEESSSAIPRVQGTQRGGARSRRPTRTPPPPPPPTKPANLMRKLMFQQQQQPGGNLYYHDEDDYYFEQPPEDLAHVSNIIVEELTLMHY